MEVKFNKNLFYGIRFIDSKEGEDELQRGIKTFNFLPVVPYRCHKDGNTIEHSAEG